MAGDLHRDRLDPALAHDREQRLQVGGLGGGALGLMRSSPMRISTVPISPVARPAPCRPPSTRYAVVVLPEVPVMPICSRSRAGAAVDRGRQLAHPRPRVVDHQHRQAGGGGALGARRVGQHRDRAQAGRLRGEVGAVEAGARAGRRTRRRGGPRASHG